MKSYYRNRSRPANIGSCQQYATYFFNLWIFGKILLEDHRWYSDSDSSFKGVSWPTDQAGQALILVKSFLYQSSITSPFIHLI